MINVVFVEGKIYQYIW